MFNHARTLLINVDGPNNPGPDFFCEELVPVEYRQLALSSSLDQLRAILFGADPDRAMLNYRARQFMSLLHSTELEEYVLDLDPRITYDTPGDHDPALVSTFEPQVRQIAGDAEYSLYTQGTPAPPDQAGIMQLQYDVDVLQTDTIEVKRQTPPPSSLIYDHSLSSGLSPAYILQGSGYSFKVNTDSPGARWLVDILLRPQWDLGQIAALIAMQGEPFILDLFSPWTEEPWKTFYNLWLGNKEMPYRLGGVLLALIYKTEQVRRFDA